MSIRNEARRVARAAKMLGIHQADTRVEKFYPGEVQGLVFTDGRGHSCLVRITSDNPGATGRLGAMADRWEEPVVYDVLVEDGRHHVTMPPGVLAVEPLAEWAGRSPRESQRVVGDLLADFARRRSAAKTRAERTEVYVDALPSVALGQVLKDPGQASEILSGHRNRQSAPRKVARWQTSGLGETVARQVVQRVGAREALRLPFDPPFAQAVRRNGLDRLPVELAHSVGGTFKEMDEESRRLWMWDALLDLPLIVRCEQAHLLQKVAWELISPRPEDRRREVWRLSDRLIWKHARSRAAYAAAIMLVNAQEKDVDGPVEPWETVSSAQAFLARRVDTPLAAGVNESLLEPYPSAAAIKAEVEEQATTGALVLRIPLRVLATQRKGGGDE